mmetsp:Transcript_50598/g.107781  ORF Transcript_50598/g.107781 Transcript_50598/m.107781 type:complete len:192 (+) Transcript_50598:102-677(+)|eukprot:CAMPEP_0172529060 /NCGR_PEP_ID=MMETSP1067-20121228/3236_1 /TAXON_ID=265564 ORGANISM="Thalassiosira punctigera, Strain Tpunct2005C2" /NCGR_SAMPLE_ID=MMETSP1067 /ASSEMBLY_ACC=CAM_ASM_000444 /LENGTH=191 /DNA_ID=CAMNT_0013313049 /DNA_START=78 /DNA_END=653 /DNA_ORIENTATION=-
MKLIQPVTIAMSIAAIHGFSQSPQPVSRRDVVSNTLASIVAISLPGAANAIQSCPPGSKNCLRQTWTPPSSTSAADAVSQLRDALNAYPQEGQEDGKVDGGGYTIVSDNLGDSSGSITLEYRSSGKGTFAKLFNGGKPFVDDLVIESNGSAFEFRSASRVGDSDFGVNGKRLSYLGGLLKGKGWGGVGLPN